jgi:hypothetical protein
MSYFANAIIENGQRYAGFPRSIGVAELPDSNVVIEIASEVGWTEKDGPIWSLIIGEGRGGPVHPCRKRVRPVRVCFGVNPTSSSRF